MATHFWHRSIFMLRIPTPITRNTASLKCTASDPASRVFLLGAVG